MNAVALATEDELSEAVGQKLLGEVHLSAQLLLRQNGSGYLRKNMPKWCQMATNGVPVVLITDLDRVRCAPKLVDEWLGNNLPPQNLVFRVAVREVESWLIADEVAARLLLGTRAKIPHEPDALPDPKGFILNLARHAPRSMRNDLVAEEGAMARQGLGYNRVLTTLVADEWSPSRASKRSPSLATARQRLRELAKRLS